jgi:DNA-binding NtrC family response regulator
MNPSPMNKELIIIDDDDILLVILEKMFEKINPNLKISTFIKGTDALAFLKNSVFDQAPTLLVDLHLKDLKDWDFLDKLETDERFRSKVFIITSSVNSENPSISKRYKNVAGFFEKPLTFDIVQRINQLIMESNPT